MQKCVCKKVNVRLKRVHATAKVDQRLHLQGVHVFVVIFYEINHSLQRVARRDHNLVQFWGPIPKGLPGYKLQGYGMLNNGL